MADRARAVRSAGAHRVSPSKGYTDTAITPAVERLLQDRTLDDRRAATAVARTEARVRRHGPHRVWVS